MAEVLKRVTDTVVFGVKRKNSRPVIGVYVVLYHELSHAIVGQTSTDKYGRWEIVLNTPTPASGTYQIQFYGSGLIAALPPDGDWEFVTISGADLISVILSNEAHVLSCDTNGHVFNNQLGISGTTYTRVYAFMGASGITGVSGIPGDMEFQIESITVSSGLTAVIAVSNIDVYVNTFTDATEGGYVDINVLVNATGVSNTVTKRFSISKSKRGIDGPGGGEPGPALVYKGLWNDHTEYTGSGLVHDCVKDDVDGLYYYAILTQTGNQPKDSAASWTLFAEQFASVATDLLLAQDTAVGRSLTLGTDALGTGNYGILRSATASALYTGNGFYLAGNASGTGVFRVGTVSGGALTKGLLWDGATGDFIIEAANFSLDIYGNITATNVDLTGTITADAGTIGGWGIDDTQLSKRVSIHLPFDTAEVIMSTASPKAFDSLPIEAGFTIARQIDSETKYWNGLVAENVNSLGEAVIFFAGWDGHEGAPYNLNTSPFYVRSDGYLKATSGAIGASSFTDTAITGGIIQTKADPGSGDRQRLVMSGTDHSLLFYNYFNTVAVKIGDHVYGENDGIRIYGVLNIEVSTIDGNSIIRTVGTMTGTNVYGLNMDVITTGAYTADGVHSLARGTSGAGTARGIYASASGASVNWAGYFDAGNVYVANVFQEEAHFKIKELAVSPNTPLTGYGHLYVKTDHKIWFRNIDGTEFDLTAGSMADLLNISTMTLSDINRFIAGDGNYDVKTKFELAPYLSYGSLLSWRVPVTVEYWLAGQFKPWEISPLTWAYATDHIGSTVVAVNATHKKFRLTYQLVGQYTMANIIMVEQGYTTRDYTIKVEVSNDANFVTGVTTLVNNVTYTQASVAVIPLYPVIIEEYIRITFDVTLTDAETFRISALDLRTFRPTDQGGVGEYSRLPFAWDYNREMTFYGPLNIITTTAQSNPITLYNTAAGSLSNTIGLAIAYMQTDQSSYAIFGQIQVTATSIEHSDEIGNIIFNTINGGTLGESFAIIGRDARFQRGLYFKELATSPDLSANYGALYVKTDGKIWFRNDSGTEYDLTTGGTGGPVTGTGTANTIAMWDGTTSLTNSPFTVSSNNVTAAGVLTVNGTIADGVGVAVTPAYNLSTGTFAGVHTSISGTPTGVASYIGVRGIAVGYGPNATNIGIGAAALGAGGATNWAGYFLGNVYMSAVAQIDNRVQLKEISPPGDPGAGYGSLYATTDGKIWYNAGTAYDLTASVSGSGDAIKANDEEITGQWSFIHASPCVSFGKLDQELGVTRYYNAGGDYTEVRPHTSTSNNIVTLPQVTGTLALLSNIVVTRIYFERNGIPDDTEGANGESCWDNRAVELGGQIKYQKLGGIWRQSG